MTTPWDRQEKESPKAYKAFIAYKDMGPDRSLAKVVEKAGKGKTGYLRQLKAWSAKYGWVARAEAWDDHLADVAVEAMEQKRREMAERQLEVANYQQSLGRIIMSIAAQELSRLEETLKGGKPLNLTTDQIARLLDIANRTTGEGNRTERQVLGEPDLKVEFPTVYKFIMEWNDGRTEEV